MSDDYDERADSPRNESELSTPRSEGFDYAPGRNAPRGRPRSSRTSSVSVSTSESESDHDREHNRDHEHEHVSPSGRTMDEAHREVQGSRESLTDRFKRYIRRILPGGRRSPPARKRIEYRVPLERYGRARSPSRSSSGRSSGNSYEFDERYDTNSPGAGHRPRHVRANFHYNNEEGNDENENDDDEEEGEIDQAKQKRPQYEADEEDEIYDPSGRAGRSRHVVGSGAAHADREPAENEGPTSSASVELSGEEEEDEAGLEEDYDMGVTDEETYLTDRPPAAARGRRSRSRSRSRSSSRGSRRTGSRSGSRSRTRSNSQSRARSASGSRASSRGSRRSRSRSR